MSSNMLTLTLKNKSKTTKRVSQNRFVDLLCSIAIVLCLYFYQYSSFVPGVTIGEFMLIFACIIAFFSFQKTFDKQFATGILLIYLSCLFCSILSLKLSSFDFVLESQSIIYSRWLRFFAYVLFILVFCFSGMKLRYALKVYIFLAVFVSVYSILQAFIFVSFHYYLPINIMPFPFSNGVTTETAVATSASYFRGYGIFTEPSHLVKFLLPAVCFSLDGCRKKRSGYILLLIFSFSIVLSSSLQGILILGISLFLFVVFSKRIRFIIKILFAIVAILLFVLFAISGRFDSVMSRLYDFFTGNLDGSMGFRVFKGFAVFKQLPFFNQMFGVGMGNLANFIKSNGITTRYDTFIMDADSLNYVSGISSLLLEGGLISTIIYIPFLFSLFRKSNLCGKIILIQLILIQFSTNGFFSLFMLFYIFMNREASFNKQQK